MVEEIVKYTLLLAMGTLVVLDVVLGTNKDPKDDIAVLIYSLTVKAGIVIPFIWGVVLSHLYFGSSYLMFKDYDTSNLNGMLIAIGISCILALIGWKTELEPKRSVIFLLLGTGMLYGHFFWTMHGKTPLF